MAIILFIAGIIISYLVIKFAVKQAISESLEDIKITIKDAIVEGLHEHEYKKTNDKSDICP